jgi:glycogen operon protein
LLLIVNAHHDPVQFKLPQVAGGARWELLTDTNSPDEAQVKPFRFGYAYRVLERSLYLFALKPATPRGIIRRAQQALRTAAETPAPLPEGAAAPEATPEPA